jgi:predicted NAD/FAD-binding protein
VNKNRHIAVIGSGISGAICAWLLREHATVDLLECDSRFGGHTHTVLVEEPGRETGPVAIDTGFMVFNEPNYPLFSALLRHLDVPVYATDMSFSASFGNGTLEYAGSDLNTLFGQRRNLVSPRFWAMLLDILRFNRAAQRIRPGDIDSGQALDDFLDRIGVGQTMRDHYLYPMAAAIWSCPDGQVGRFPAASFIRFFNNHGLINITDRPRWKTIDGGSRSYMNKLIADLGHAAHCGADVSRIERLAEGVRVTWADGRVAVYDDVVIATHSDQALALLAAPTAEERSLLAAVRYQPNRVVLHTDDRLMPRQRRVWSSWNYLGDVRAGQQQAVSVTYWMNSLQRLDTQRQYFVTLNPAHEPRAEHIVDEFEYRHPVFDAAALEAQRQLHRIQGHNGVWYAGAWTGYGFHEDGMRSGVEVARALGAVIPWEAEVIASRDLSMIGQLVDEAA